MILSASTIRDQNVDNPNLDGDYIALLEQLKKSERPHSARAWIKKSVTKESENLKIERVIDYSHLFDAVERNNVSLLYDTDLKDAHYNGKNLLHHSVLLEKRDITNFLIQNQPALCLENFEIHVRGLPSSKNAIHVLAERGDLDTIKTILSYISKKDFDKYVHQTVLTEISGQRPRLLSILHLAALHGHTELVTYLIKDVGMSVDLTNNKNDTPILWAAR